MLFQDFLEIDKVHLICSAGDTHHIPLDLDDTTAFSELNIVLVVAHTSHGNQVVGEPQNI